MPCAATFSLVFRRLDWGQLAAVLGTWAAAVLGALPGTASASTALAVDGKTLRGSRKQGTPAVHLLSVVSDRLGQTLGQQVVDDTTNEIPVTPLLLRGLVLEGGGDDVMLVTGTQPQMEQDIADVCGSPPPVVIRPGTPPKPGTPATAVGSGALSP